MKTRLTYTIRATGDPAALDAELRAFATAHGFEVSDVKIEQADEFYEQDDHHVPHHP